MALGTGHVECDTSLNEVFLLALSSVVKPTYQPCPLVAGDYDLRKQKHLKLVPICLGC